MKLKEENKFLEGLITSSLKELSDIYSKQHNANIIFDTYTSPSHKDNEGNICTSRVVDYRIEDDKGKIVSFKRLYDKWIVQRKNIGSLEEPKYGKQENVEESQNIMFKEIIRKAIAGFAIGLSAQTKEGIEEFNRIVGEEAQDIPQD